MRAPVKAAIVILGLLLAGIAAWKLSRPPEPPVELTFVRYEYDTVVLRLINRTSLRFMVAGADPPNVPFDSSLTRYVEPRGELQLWTTRTKRSPSSLPSKIEVQCIPLPSRRRVQFTRLLKKIGINIAVTNRTTSVNLPPLEPAPVLP